MGRKPLGDRAMTAAERQRRHRSDLAEPMSRSERDDLQRLIRQREKVLKTAAKERFQCPGAVN
jgi:hypothetical protein